MQLKWAAFGVGALVAVPAMGQQLDPRLAGPAVQAMQGNLAFAEARIKVMIEDNEAMRKRLCDLIEEGKRPAECKNDNKP